MFARRRCCCFACSLFWGREPPWADANVAYQTTQTIVDRGALSIQLSAPSYFSLSTTAKVRLCFAFGTAIAQIPSYLAFRALRKLPGLTPGPWYAMASHLSSALWMSRWRLRCLRGGLSGSARRAQAVALAFVLQLGTLCLVYGRSSYGEALQAFCSPGFVDLTLLASEQKRKKTLLLCVGCAPGCCCTPSWSTAPCCPLGSACFVGAPQGWTLGQLARSAVYWCAAWNCALLVHNWVKTGHPLRTGYQSGQLGLFDGDLLSGLFGCCFRRDEDLCFTRRRFCWACWESIGRGKPSGG